METRTISVKKFLLNYFKTILYLTIFLSLIVLLLYYFKPQYIENFSIEEDASLLFIYFLVGFVAQTIDGALGMGYGITCTSALISSGVSPALASASVHIAKLFTSGSSGFFHWKLGNVDKTLFKRLAIPGSIGAGVGAYFLSSIDGEKIKPYISAYLLIMGIIVIVKAFKTVALKQPKKVGFLAFTGGFVDASGGGGWGPVVTTTLLARGNNPTKTIGTVNAVEFVITVFASGIFTVLLGINNSEIIAALIIGGLISSPFGAILIHYINRKWSMIAVGLLIIFLSSRIILKTFGLWF